MNPNYANNLSTEDTFFRGAWKIKFLSAVQLLWLCLSISLGIQARASIIGSKIIFAGETLTGKIAPGEVRFYYFVASAGDTFTLAVGQSTPSEIRPQITLIASDGERLFSSWDFVQTSIWGQINLAGEYCALVTDHSMQSTGNFWITLTLVPPPPTIQTVTQAAGTIVFTWTATIGQMYQVQYKNSLDQTVWSNLGDTIKATTLVVTSSDVVGPISQRFYRVRYVTQLASENIFAE